MGVYGCSPHGPGLAKVASVRALVFEMGDVLYDATHWWRWLANLLSRLGPPAGYVGLYRRWRTCYLADVHCGRREHGEAFEAFLASIGLTRGQIDEIVAVSHGRKRDLEATLRPLPGVRQTIARLHSEGIQLAVLADCEAPAARLVERLERLGLSGRFSAVLSSFDLERAKPDPACYQAALSALSLPADRVAFVGHEAAELAGATAVGMPAIAANYEQGAVADAYLERFADLLDAIDATCPAAAS